MREIEVQEILKVVRPLQLTLLLENPLRVPLFRYCYRAKIPLLHSLTNPRQALQKPRPSLLTTREELTLEEKENYNSNSFGKVKG